MTADGRYVVAKPTSREMKDDNGKSLGTLHKHRIADHDNAWTSNVILRQRVAEHVKPHEDRFAKFKQQWKVRGLPPIGPGKDELGYVNWVKAEKLIAELEDAADVADREAYIEMFRAATPDEMSNAIRMEYCCIFDAYNCDPRNPLLTVGRVEMGIQHMQDIINFYPLPHPESGFPVESNEVAASDEEALEMVVQTFDGEGLKDLPSAAPAQKTPKRSKTKSGVTVGDAPNRTSTPQTSAGSEDTESSATVPELAPPAPLTVVPDADYVDHLIPDGCRMVLILGPGGVPDLIDIVPLDEVQDTVNSLF